MAMFTGRTILVACAALALVAVTSLADETDTEGIGPAGYSTARRFRQTSAPQRVTIWRGGKPSLASTQASEDELGEVPPQPPNAPGGYDPGDTGPSSDPGTPFLDEPTGEYPNPQCTNCAGPECTGYGGSECASCDGPCVCSPPWWAHRHSIFAQSLYLQPTGIDMAHAIQQNGTGGFGTTPEGRVGVVEPDYTSAYSAGFAVALGACASVQANYTNYHSHDTDSLAAPDVLGGTVASLVLHPQSLNAGSTSSLVSAANDIDYQLADVEYRRLLAGGCRFALDYAVGARYANLSQQFLQIGEFAPPTGTIQTTTNIDFEGGGIRSGLDGMQRLGNTGLGVYGKGFINLVFGRFNTSYNQLDLTTDSVQAASNWEDERVVPILEYEVGINWTNYNGCWRASFGYYNAFWFNTIATPEYVQAVQNADFVDLGETLAFDGLVTRLEFRY
jgi:hypothetical protein